MQRIDLRSLIREAQDGFDVWLDFLDDYGLTSRKVAGSYRFKESSGLHLHRSKSGDVILSNYSQKIDLPSGNIYQAIAHAKGLDPRQDLIKISHVLAGYLGKSVPTLDENHQPYKRKFKKETLEYKPNDGKKLKKTFLPTFASWSSHVGQATIEYFAEYGVSLQALKKYKIRPLAKVTHIASGFTTKFSAQDFAFAYCINGARGTIKAKRPNASDRSKRQYKEFYIQNKGNYCFGFEQLPPNKRKDGILLICGGEKDALVLNQHFNKYDIYAICYHSETANINKEHLQKLRSRFARVLTCFDNDSGKKRNTGREAMLKNAITHGIPFVDIAKYTDQNDVSDILINEGPRKLRAIICKECQFKHAIAQREDDPFSIPVPDALRLDVDQYIGEYQHTVESLNQLIAENPRLALEAPTGSGKTWGMMSLASENNFFGEGKGFNTTVFCFPTTAILEQAYKDYTKNFGSNATVVYGHTDDVDIDSAQEAGVIFTTYNSLHKVGACLGENNNTLLIIDEFHELRNAHNYRAKSVSDVMEYAQLAKHSVLISATPLYHFTTGLADCLNYRLCVVVKKSPQRIIVRPLAYTDGSEKDVMKHFKQTATEKDKVYLIKKNDVALLEAFQKSVEADGKTMEILSSKHSKYKEDNPNYQSLMETGRLKNKVNFIGTTSLLEAGTSVKEEVGGIAIVNEKCKDSITQFCARPRYNPETDSNKTIQVHYYHKENETEPNKRIPHTTERLKAAIEMAEKQAQFMNSFQSAHSDTAHKALDDFAFVYFSSLWGEWRVDYLGILSSEYNFEKANTTTKELFGRITHYQPHIEFLSVESVDMEEDAETREETKQTKEERKSNQVKAFGLLETKGANAILEAAYRHTKNTKLKSKIRKQISIGRETSEGAQEIIDEHKEIVSGGFLDKPAKRYIELDRLGLPKHKIPKILNAHTDAGAYRTIKNTLITESELHQAKTDPSQLSGKSLARVQNYTKIIEAVNKKKDALRKRKKGYGVLLSEVVSLIQTAIGDELVTPKRAVMRLTELFEVDTERRKKDGKFFRLYHIGNRKNLTKILRNSETSKSE